MALLLVHASGCVAPEEPRPVGQGGTLPLWVQNDAGSTREVQVRVLDPGARSVVHEATVHLSPGAVTAVETPWLPYGSYVLHAGVEGQARERTVSFDGSAAYYRFVVESDLIGFQSG